MFHLIISFILSFFSFKLINFISKLPNPKFFHTETGITVGVVEACKREYENKEREWEERMGEVIEEKQKKLVGLFDLARFSEQRR